MPLLFAARLQAEQVRDTAAASSAPDRQDQQEPLARLVDYLQQASAEARRLIVETHPPELEQSSWHQALEHYLQRGLPPHGVEIELQLEPATASVPGPVALALYRIAQEAIRNALRHAAPRRIEVTCRGDGAEHAVLDIVDDGRGFDSNAVDPNRFGLRNIRARAEAVGGRASIDSTPGAGTTVRVEV